MGPMAFCVVPYRLVVYRIDYGQCGYLVILVMFSDNGIAYRA